MKQYSDKIILTGIKTRKNDIVEYLYKDYFPQVMRIVIKHGGNEQDARDLFQEALIIIFNRLRNDDLEITSSFHNYFIVLSRFIWFRQNNINKSYTTSEDLEEIHPAEPLPDELEHEVQKEKVVTDYLENQKEKIFQRHYRKLPGDCKRVLKMFFRKRSFREVAKRMEYTNEDYARRKKYLCMQQLMRMINQDPEYIRITGKKK